MPFLRIAFVGILVLSAGCGDSKKSEKPAPEEEQEQACQDNEDCTKGWVCLDGECANTASGAIYTDPSSAVTPDKVKAQVDQINANRQKRADELLEGL